jgi:hypothetical protein
MMHSIFAKARWWVDKTGTNTMCIWQIPSIARRSYEKVTNSPMCTGASHVEARRDQGVTRAPSVLILASILLCLHAVPGNL